MKSKKEDTFVIKKTHKFPKGINQSTQASIKKYWFETRGIDLDQPQYTIYSKAEQEKERKQKLSLDRRTIKSTNDDEYYTNRERIRSQGYDNINLGFSTGNWKSILEREKELKARGYKIKISFYKGFYTLWWK